MRAYLAGFSERAASRTDGKIVDVKLRAETAGSVRQIESGEVVSGDLFND